VSQENVTQGACLAAPLVLRSFDAPMIKHLFSDRQKELLAAQAALHAPQRSSVDPSQQRCQVHNNKFVLFVADIICGIPSEWENPQIVTNGISHATSGFGRHTTQGT